MYEFLMLVYVYLLDPLMQDTNKTRKRYHEPPVAYLSMVAVNLEIFRIWVPE